ncbi:MAG: protein-glutamate O-methyltransferase CheR [Planctomycetota bacterium]
MTVAADTITLSDATFDRLAQIAFDRSGVRVRADHRKMLESGLWPRLEELGLDDFDQYVSLLSMGPYQHQEFQEMLDRITPHDASFFRGESQLAVVEQVVLAELLEARQTTRRLRIWSAACASGADAYALAMMVHRSLGASLWDWHVEILGTDISERRLEIALEGCYSEEALRGTPEAAKQRYFERHGKGWRVHDDIRSLVSFKPHTLKDALAARRHGVWDAIICRDGLVDLDPDTRGKVLDLFRRQLADDGTLVLGPSDGIGPADGPFVARAEPGGFCYRKA